MICHPQLKSFLALRHLFLLVLSLGLFFASDLCSAAARSSLKKITVDDNYIYVNGEQFFVKGICYSPLYPGEHHGRKRTKANVAEDLKNIKELGANTIVLYRREEEKVYREARKQGLMILQGIWMEQDPRDFHDDWFKRSVKRQIRNTINAIANLQGGDYSDTILAFWVGGELNPSYVSATNNRYPDFPVYEGEYYSAPYNATAAESFFAEVCDAGRQHAKETYGYDFLFTHINWPPNEQMLLEFLDIVLFDIYSYWPQSIAEYRRGSFSPTSYQGYIEHIKSIYPKTPFIISEFGYSTAPANTNEAGNDETDQAAELTARWHDIVTASRPIAGGSVFEWNDEWWKQGKGVDVVRNDYNTHEPEDYEEWFGVIGINGTLRNYTVRPKPGYYSIQRMYSPAFYEDRRTLAPLRLLNFGKGEDKKLQSGSLAVRWQPKEKNDWSRTLNLAHKGLASGDDRTLPYRLTFKDKRGKDKTLDCFAQLFLAFELKSTSKSANDKLRIGLESYRSMAPDLAPIGWSRQLTAYLTSEASEPDEQGWQRVTIPLDHFGPLDFSTLKALHFEFGGVANEATDVAIKNIQWLPNGLR